MFSAELLVMLAKQTVALHCRTERNTKTRSGQAEHSVRALGTYSNHCAVRWLEEPTVVGADDKPVLVSELF